VLLSFYADRQALPIRCTVTAGLLFAGAVALGLLPRRFPFTG
jgi:hypothetical protein